MESTTINGVGYYYSIEYYEDGSVKRGTEVYRIVDGVEYKSTPAIEYHSGTTNVKSGTLYSYATITNMLTGGSDYSVVYKGNAEIEYYTNGNVKKGTLYSTTTINSVVYKTDTEIEYYENGNVKKRHLKRKYRYWWGNLPR